MGDPTAILFQYGVAGVALAACGMVIKQLYSDNKALQLRLDASQEARRVDAVQTNEKIVPVMSDFSKAVLLVYSKLKSAKDE